METLNMFIITQIYMDIKYEKHNNNKYMYSYIQ